MLDPKKWIAELLRKDEHDFHPGRRKPAPSDSPRAPLPPWVPPGVDYEDLPPEAQDALTRIVGPLYEQLVAQTRSHVARATGMTLVYLAWLEAVAQLQLAKKTFDACQNLDFCGEGLERVTSRFLRLAAAQARTGAYLMRLLKFEKAQEQGRGTDFSPFGAAQDAATWASPASGEGEGQQSGLTFTLRRPGDEETPNSQSVTQHTTGGNASPFAENPHSVDQKPTAEDRGTDFSSFGAARDAAASASPASGEGEGQRSGRKSTLRRPADEETPNSQSVTQHTTGGNASPFAENPHSVDQNLPPEKAIPLAEDDEREANIREYVEALDRRMSGLPPKHLGLRKPR